jgi:hypothetical protein
MKCRLLYLFFAIVLASNISFSQDNNPKETKSISFPDDWLGVWKGKLKIYSPKGLAQEVDMKIENLPTDTIDVYQWALIYGEDEVKGRRNYFLKVIDREKGHYVVDEKNGILIDAFLFNNKLISNFEVMNNQLTSIYDLTDDTMIFEIYVNKTTPISTTGNIESENGEKIPEVKSYPISGYQKAILCKQKD